MTTYKEIKGTQIEVLESDPSNPVEGQVWYNSTSNVLKGQAATTAGAWSTTNTLNNPRYEFQGVGTQTAGLFIAGNTPGGYSANVELYNGTSFSETGDINTATRNFGAAGTSTSAVIWGGQADVDMTETWNGSSWTSAAAIPGDRYGATGNIGVSNSSAIAAGGNNGSNNTFSWNGSSWTALNNMNVSRELGAGQGTVSAAVEWGGDNPSPGRLADTELWNGTNWTEVNNLNLARRLVGGMGGSSTVAFAVSGDQAPTSDTEQWNGTNWTEVANLNNSMGGGTAAAGSGSTAGVAAYLDKAEQWNGAGVSVTRTFTDS